MTSIQEMLKRAREQRIVRRVLAILCVIVLFVTNQQLKLKADTLERYADCGYPDHVHDESCYVDGVLTCDEHVHTDACYQSRPVEEAVEAEVDVSDDIPAEEVMDIVVEEDADDVAEAEVAIDDVIAAEEESDAEELTFMLGGEEVFAEDGEPGEIALPADKTDAGSVTVQPAADTGVEGLIVDEYLPLFATDEPAGEFVPDSTEETDDSIYDESGDTGIISADVPDDEPADAVTITSDEAVEDAEPTRDEQPQAPAEITARPGEGVESEEIASPGEDIETEESVKPGEDMETAEADQPGEGEKTEEAGHPVEGVETEETGQPREGTETAEAEQPEEDIETEEAEQPGEGEETEEAGQPEEGEANQQPEQPEEESETAAAARTAFIALNEVPMSLSAMMEKAAIAEAPVEGAAETDADKTASDAAEAEPADVPEAVPADEWKLTYDESVLAVEFTGEDYLITPVASFEETVITVSAGDTCILTLGAWEMPAEAADGETDETGEGAAEEAPEAAEYPARELEAEAGNLRIHVQAPEGALPVNAVLTAAPVEDEAVLAAIANAIATPAGASEETDQPAEESAGTEDPTEDADAEAEAGPADASEPEAASAEEAAAAPATLVYAAALAFADGKGESIQPLAPVRVTLRADGADRTVVRVDTAGVCAVVETDETGAFQISEGGVYALAGVVCPQTEETVAVETPEALLYPAQAFEDSTDAIHVSVTAPEGAFPEGTTMTVSPVIADDMLTTIAEAAGDVMVKKVYAVDITFFNVNGEKIEPLAPISVVMKKVETPAAESEPEAEEMTAPIPVVVHVDDEGAASVVEQDEAPAEEAEAGTDAVVFTSDTFSIYAYVETLETNVIAADGETYRITVTYGPEANIPVDAALDVKEIADDAREAYLAETEEALERKGAVSLARFFDITIRANGETVQPAAPVQVKIELADAPEESVHAIHFPDEGEPEEIATEAAGNAVSFQANGFSVYGVVYTVDFHWEVDGRQYEFSMTGGSALSLSRLVEALDIARDDADTEEDEAAAFLESVEIVTFSNPDLLWAGKVEHTATVGMLKAANGIDCEYSAELTDEEIVEMDAEEIQSGDWVLISMRPFDSQECLTVTMDDGERFTIAVTDAQLKKYVISAEGETYEITVTYADASGIPEDAELVVEEILPEETLPEEAVGPEEILPEEAKDPEETVGPEEALPEESVSPEDDVTATSAYAAYVSMTENALGMEEGTAGYIRLFDISIVDKDDHDIKYQPAEGSSVAVRIELADSSSERMNVVHFSDGSEEGEALQSSTENGENGSVVEFQTDSFSVYSIVDAPEPIYFDPYKLSSIGEIDENTEYWLSYGSSEKYFTSELNNEGCLVENANQSAAAKWHFEKADEDGSALYIYTLSGEDKRYIHQVTPQTNKIELAESGTAFILSETSTPNAFIFKHVSEERYLQHSNGGKGIRFYTDVNNTGNSRIFITNTNMAASQHDPYGLEGKAFGIAYNDNSTVAVAVSAAGVTVNNQNRLEGTDMRIRTDVLNNSGNLLVAENSDIQEWTFESIERDRYYIKTTADGAVKYLCINNNSVTLVDDQASASMIQATPGTGENSGKWHFTVNGYSLNFSGSAANGFNAARNSNASTWLNLVEKTILSDDDFVEYTARKISASDDILSATEKDDNGGILTDDAGNPVYRQEKTRVVIYTRVWNESTKKYEFYAVDHDGSLIRVYESGDHINWIGDQVNSALWEFTEYTNNDGTPSYFYELENTAYSGTYLAPSSDNIISHQPVGINLNGRKDGFDYTSIVAWDDPAYAYAGLKIERDANGSLRVVTCPIDEAADFHFAVIAPPVGEADPVSDVATVDNNEFGISIRMIDFNNTIDNNNRDTVQRSYLGFTPWDQDHAFEAETGLVSTNLTEGYPTITANTDKNGSSLSGLFNNMTPANHLFIQSIYNESGYFEYDSTQNFAHLNADGNFTVYNQLGAIGTNTGSTRAHGQFMPYNDISPETGYARDTQGNVITNRYNVRGQELLDTDPRKGEPLYSIPQKQADYYFGMELSAVFTQTPDGVDNWGHDIIFEFTGDDDFWFYVDGELVLDLGGVHSALGGSVNFRTGEVVCNGTQTTLYEVFKSNYQARGKDVADVDELFVTKTVNGQTVHVFSDYTTHEMKMFYMERGAGASNLKMRFNLASVKPGTVELSKRLKGIDNASNKLIQYPYQIWYQTAEYAQNADGTYMLDEDGNRVVDHYNDAVLLTQPTANANLTGQVYAVYKGTRTLIPYKESMTVGGITYDNVFLLKAGETAVINFPENTYRYKLVECGVDTSVYEHVYINGDQSGNEIFGKPHNNTDGWDPAGGPETPPASTTLYEGTARSDFGITYYTTEGRPRVEYTNEVSPEVMRTVSFKKVLYNTVGVRLSDEVAAQIPSGFSFRLYLGNEFADQENLLPADMYTYYVKGPDQNYCKWDKAGSTFVSLGVDTFEEFKGLSEADQRAGTFTTSMYGSISKIPAGYTVEVRDLIVGTKYKIEEPDGELPKGYTRRDSDGYVRTDPAGGPFVYYTEEGAYGRHLEAGNTITAEPISDTIADKTESPEIEIRNQEGWGLTAKKEWTDKDFMIHDPIYLAIYLRTGSEPDFEYTLLPDKVRQLTNSDTEAYFFFQDLKVNEEAYGFDQFVVREVELTPGEGNTLAVDSDGKVTVDDSVEVTPIDDGNSITVGGTPAGGAYREETYRVSYQTGHPTGHNDNIRVDTVTNSRPGIQIFKKDWEDANYLSGAAFTLKDVNGNHVAAASYTSDSSGLVTTAYLSPGVYKLAEIKSPSGYVAMEGEITITVSKDGADNADVFTVDGDDAYYSFSPATGDSMARITVKNRTLTGLKIVKAGVDGEARTLLGGVHFALYDQVTDNEGNLRPAYSPRTGFEDLVTNANGEIEEIGMDLGTGTYYLREKAAPSGYKKLADDLRFTIGEDGTVTIHNREYVGWLTTDKSDSGAVSYLIGVENTPLGITIRKTDENGSLLTGAQFELSRKTDGDMFEIVSDCVSVVNGQINMTATAEMTFTGLPTGIYKLKETHAPSGYIITTGDICFSIADGAVTLTDADGNETTYSSVSLADENTTIVVKNTPGSVLPATGGPGTARLYCLGIMMIVLAGAGLLVLKKKKALLPY